MLGDEASEMPLREGNTACCCWLGDEANMLRRGSAGVGGMATYLRVTRPNGMAPGCDTAAPGAGVAP